VLIGDARREAMLADANVTTARSVILATDDDLANLEIALDARRVVPNIRVVLRMFDQNMADKIREGFNIRLAMSQSAISAPRFAMAAIDRSIVNSFIVGDQLIVVQRCLVRPDGPLCGRTLSEILREGRFGVLRRRTTSGLTQVFPSGETRIEAGDELLVQGTLELLDGLNERMADAWTTAPATSAAGSSAQVRAPGYDD
jgi:Trk K+ transport system NAD-binding subunit